jgi:FkbM family methyltransferase
MYGLAKRALKRNAGKAVSRIAELSTMVPQTISQNLVSSTTVDGMKVFFRPLVLGDLQVVLTEYEKHILKVFKPKDGDVVIDVGAYIGYPYTLKSAKLVGVSGKVISIEPDPRNFRILATNVESNGLHNVILLNVAVSEKDGESLLYVRRAPMVSRIQIPEKAKPLNVIRSVRVKTRSIYSILKQYSIPKVDWIKIDAEGAEMLILRGAKGLLSSPKLNIVLETYPPNREEVIRYLLGYHFKIKPLSAHELFAYK